MRLRRRRTEEHPSNNTLAVSLSDEADRVERAIKALALHAEAIEDRVAVPLKLERKDGTVQVTYKGHPVYGFVEDKKPGETNGNDFKGFGAQWYALMPNGEEPADG